MTERKGISLWRLSFTGSGKPTASLDFGPALNVLYGGSNAGKSFVLKAIDYVLGGGDQLPAIKESDGYEHVFLSFVLEPEGRHVTLRRGTRGGAIEWYHGVEDERGIDAVAPVALVAKHGKAMKSLSERLLQEIGIEGATIAANQAGAPQAFTFRSFVPYVLVNEARMLGDDSPIRQADRAKPGAAKNAFRYIVTGQDDSSISRVPSTVEAKAAKAGKIELLESMLADAEARLEGLSPGPDAGEEDEERLELLGRTLEERQTLLDELVKERRDLRDKRDLNRASMDELGTMLVRFRDLEDVFRSDIRRLEAIEEGGFLLRRFDDQPCPLCGAAPGHQHTPHSPEDLERQHQAAVAEIAKIERDISELRATIVSVEAEYQGHVNRDSALADQLRSLDSRIGEARPGEAASREEYATLQARVGRARARAEAAEHRDYLAGQMAEIARAATRRRTAENLQMGIDGPTGHRISMVVAEVLKAWGFPNVESVRWNPETDDIEVNGYGRRQNGKGVKAIFHSAFKVAVLIHCRRRSLPHPGFVVLDSPLVTYRKPIMNDRHGELSEDERAIRETSLDLRFYRHLHSLADMGQFLVVENADPPEEVSGFARVEVFAGESGAGRQGLFPPARNP